MKKTVRKVVGALLIATSLIVTQIPSLETQAGVQNINFLMDNTTLEEYTGTEISVSVPDEVKKIGDSAFADNQFIGVVNAGKHTKEIGRGAFSNCNYLMSVKTSDELEIIGSAAFSGCTNLQSVYLGKNLKDVGYGVFAGCQNLRSIVVDPENRYYKVDNQVLYSKDETYLYAYMGGNTKNIYVMPNTVDHISPYAFWGNTDLQEVTLSGNLAEITGYSFSNCRNLKSVIIPYSVHSIDAKAFENCVSLGEITIPPSVTNIDPTAFDGCVKLKINADPGTAAYDFFQRFDQSDAANTENQDTRTLVSQISNTTNVIKDDKSASASSNGESTSTNANSSTSTSGAGGNFIDASKDPRNVEWMPSVDAYSATEDSSVLGKTIIVSGRALFFVDKEMHVRELNNSNNSTTQNNETSSTNNSQEQSITIEEDGSDSNSDSGDNAISVYDSGKGGYLPKYTETNGKIAMQAYYGADDMENYSIPDGINSIGRFSFARSNIARITIPQGITEIGYGAFYHCDNLNSVIFPDTLKYVDAYAFDNTPFINDSTNYDANGMLIVGDGILLKYKGNSTDVSIPGNVKSVAANAFRDNKNITSVNIPDSVGEIGSDAFRDCSNLKFVTGGNGIKNIKDRAFMGCPLQDYRIPASVEKIGLRSIDYTKTDKDNSGKVVVFDGKKLPMISADDTSKRLSNDDYRKDSLYNVLFAVVDSEVSDFDNTVLDDDLLGFSGVVISLDKDETGNYTHSATIRKNMIFSQDVIDSLPNTITIAGEQYTIAGIDVLSPTESKRNDAILTQSVKVYHNGTSDDNYRAKFSENEKTGSLSINDSEYAANALNYAYAELFGGDTADIKGYELALTDSTGTTNITRFGNSSLTVTIPLGELSDGTYHVITLDEDGQLEELNATVDSNAKNISFVTNHLSYFGIYSSDTQTQLSVKDGRLVKNLKLDESPDTGDKSIPVNYVIAVLMLSSGLLLIFLKDKNKKVKVA